MTAFVAVPNGDIDQDSPGTQPLFTALRDNPFAIAEGAPGAPYVQYGWHPYDGVTVGDGNDGAIYDFAVDGVLASFETPLFVAGYEYRFRTELLSTNNANPVTIDMFRETTAAYAGQQNFSTFGAVANIVTAWIELYSPMVANRYHAWAGISRESLGANILAPAVSVTGGATHAASQRISKVRFAINGVGSYDAGKVFMDKRRVFP